MNLCPQAPGWYEWTIVLQSCVQYAIAFGYGDISAILVASIVYVCGQYDMLFCSLKNLRATAMLLAGNKIDELRCGYA